MPARRVQSFEVATAHPEELVDVTARVQAEVAASRVRDGAVVVYCPHTTAGITVQENADPDLRLDLLEALDRLAPRAGSYRHAEGNAHAHVKAALLGSSATIVLEGGKLLLGTWQGIYLAEFDGPRRRTVQVRVLAD
jgi:secondary thiamine-phosphate synthase enzyme